MRSVGACTSRAFLLPPDTHTAASPADHVPLPWEESGRRGRPAKSLLLRRGDLRCYAVAGAVEVVVDGACQHGSANDDSERDENEQDHVLGGDRPVLVLETTPCAKPRDFHPGVKTEKHQFTPLRHPYDAFSSPLPRSKARHSSPNVPFPITDTSLTCFYVSRRFAYAHT